MKPFRTAVVVTAVAAASLVATAAPGGAAAARSTTYDGGTWTFSGSGVAGELRRHVQLTDYQGGTYFDRVAATPAATDALLQVDGVTCPDGSYYKAGVSLYGDTPDWVQLSATREVGGRVRIACTGSDGVIHHFHWGSYVAEAGLTSAQNCVRISRTGTAFSITADSLCQAQDRVVNNSGKVLSATSRPLPFAATLSFPALG